MKITKYLFVACLLLAVLSCSSDSASVKGKFAGVKNSKIIVEDISLASIKLIDSTRTNDSGEFSFKIKFENDSPMFVRVRNNNDYIILIVHPNENIELSSMLNLSNNYVVTGSEDSEKIKELNARLAASYEKISTLTKEYNNEVNPSQREKISYAIADLYVKQKQENIKFIVMNSKSLASVISLYQVFPNGISIFGDNSDFQYFRLLADSLSTVYPESPYVKSLNTTIKGFENRANLESIISEAMLNSPTVGYPEISLPGLTGETKNLSDLNGKVIVLVFWNPYQESSMFINRELKDVYDIYSQKGLEIYQVTLDPNVARWQNMVKIQNLPWINVNDPNGVNSNLIRTYNIQALPAVYLIDRKGDIVGTNLWGNDLVKKLNTLL